MNWGYFVCLTWRVLNRACEPGYKRVLISSLKPFRCVFYVLRSYFAVSVWRFLGLLQRCMFFFCFHPWRPKSALPICRITVSSSCTVIFVLTCIACLTLILALFLEPSSGHHYVSFTWKRETTKRNLFRLNQPRISFISDKVCIQTYTAWAGHTLCSNQLNYQSPRVGSHHSNHSKLRTPFSERLCRSPALVYRYSLSDHFETCFVRSVILE